MPSSTPKNILTISAARHLVGHDVSDVLVHAWSAPEVSPNDAARFINTGFNVIATDLEKNAAELREALKQKAWDGILVGWRVRGHAELTELFESIMTVLVDHIVDLRRKGAQAPRLYFCTGPEDIVSATRRNFLKET